MLDLQERMIELEIRYTHQARLIEELNDVLVAALRRIERLERENRNVREMLNALAPDLPESPDE